MVEAAKHNITVSQQIFMPPKMEDTNLFLYIFHMENFPVASIYLSATEAKLFSLSFAVGKHAIFKRVDFKAIFFCCAASLWHEIFGHFDFLYSTINHFFIRLVMAPTLMCELELFYLLTLRMIGQNEAWI